MKKKFIIHTLAAALLSCSLTSCQEETLDAILSIIGMVVTGDDTTIITDDGKGLGYLKNNEDPSKIEDDIRLNPVVGTEIDEVTGLPTMVDLTACLPRIGNQEQFGTCCAWATAYYTRTWHYALDNNLRTKDLNEKNIFSPGDVFRSLETSTKGAKCQGTYFEAVLDKFVTRGIATMAKAPYVTKDSDCDCAPSASATSDAGNYKILNYRDIGLDIQNIKRYLSENHVVMFGAKLSDSFMTLSDATVLRNHTTYNYTGIHAYHAMAIVGYDDEVGPNGAFRIVNSWGDTWGDKGFAWIDYKFFVGGDFAYCALIMNTQDSNDDNLAAKPTPSPNTGLDLIASKCTDEDYYDPDDKDSDDPTWRTLYYDVTNAGTETISSSLDWGVVYLLYNAYNANDYQVVLADIYSDKIGNVAKGECNDNWSKSEAMKITGFEAQGFSISNIDIPAKTTASEAVYGKGTKYFEWTYKLPNVTGEYYLVLMADAFGSITETSDDNNQHYLMGSDKKPLRIENGVIKTAIANNKALSLHKPSMNEQMPYQSAKGEKTANTYSPKEIRAMINNHIATGELQKKVSEWVNENTVKPRRCVKE